MHEEKSGQFEVNLYEVQTDADVELPLSSKASYHLASCHDDKGLIVTGYDSKISYDAFLFSKIIRQWTCMQSIIIHFPSFTCVLLHFIFSHFFFIF